MSDSIAEGRVSENEAGCAVTHAAGRRRSKEILDAILMRFTILQKIYMTENRHILTH